ncbi:Alkyl hydroperoxide reductase subunit C-like protein [Cystobacter fuscus DSM 2262]|uniref:thioredoxin-dependent peroxiredoxin n=1 Tax=Cystobacter fuscus (strain ATCC 25194 / DSM 2262 / NBRC 100088 / M29) TaxID=1242864 RepID=S9Q5Z4_CYSF2|nr:peroxiredoxin [Cystobacter fuscus]EPX56744.1 Alkyl hydroperoxide reductase subunit C-like protein [Cystobacter fuscus DSM 2262]
MTIKVGDEAPDFNFTHKNGSPASLKSLRQQKAVVLYFYPKDDTPGCTAQACSFRDSYEDFVQAGAEVIGVSSDDASKHEAFAARYRLPFTLVSDADGELRKRYGVPRSFLGLVPGRVTYVIDRQGVVQHVFNSQLQSTKHISEAMDVLKRLSAS